MKINLKTNLNFSKLSKDRNKIHISEHFAKNFFIKKTISHGENLVLKMLNDYLKKFKKKKFQNIEINFLSPTFTNQEFNIISRQKSIILKSKKENNVQIYLKTKNNKINNMNSLKQMFFEISRIVGNHKNRPSLILKIKILKKNNNKIRKNIIKIKKNIYNLKFSNSFYTSETLFAKLVKKRK